ncbi:short chain dehydrogenase [Patellaria atrata CBS 101060]|uniref:Short chain dehydrogenase n=1 Tax=Patellaria atrata CBS 101060 TaxID=1346257 RepID=A0A9P4VM99_9PEZI|nr:short chain dehydrogenase [Patellaria atrata CBS 101060]
MVSEPVPFSVEGKTALITGGGSGIGLALASLLLSRKCNVIIADLSFRPEAQSLIDAHSAPSSSPRVLFVRTDVTSWTQLSTLFATALASFPTIDIVVPSAGIFEPPTSSFWHPPGNSLSRDPVDGDRYKIFDLNLTHPIRVTQLALSHWLNPAPGQQKVEKENPKRVVLVSSIAGQLAGPITPLYHASKWGISGFARSLGWLDKALGVRVNAVAPGMIKTPLWTETEKWKIVDGRIQDNWISPERVAETIVGCAEKEEWGGGSVVEIADPVGGDRVVSMLGDPGPRDYGIRTESLERAVKEVFESLGEGWGVSKP